MGRQLGGWVPSPQFILLPRTSLEVLAPDIAKGGKAVGIAGTVIGLVDAMVDFFHAAS